MLKTGVAMAAVVTVATVSVALMVTLGRGSPEQTAAPTGLRAEDPAPYRLAAPRVREKPAPPRVSDVPSPRPERRERPSENRRPEAPRRLPAPAPAPARDLPRETTPNGPPVSPGELAAAGEPRRYEPRRNAAFTLTVEALGVYDVPVANAAGDAALDRGPIHLPDTDMPWGEEEQKNIYVAGHRLGYPGTDSRLLFYHLDRLRAGDMVVLKGRGRVFKYRVSETMVVDPSDRWAKEPVPGRNIVSLQTCTPIPTFEKRLVVRADKI